MKAHVKNPFGYLIHDVARLLRRRFDAAAHRHDLTMPQWRIIAQLSHSEGMSQVELAGVCETDPMTVSGLVERLEAKGLVLRLADPNDSRAKIVTITEKALSMVSELRELAEEIYAEAFAGVSDADRAVALSVLTRISANLSGQRAQVKEEVA